MPENRSVLAKITALLGSVATMTLGAMGGGFFLSPALQKKEESWMDLGRTDAFQPQAPAKVEFIERKRDSWVTSEHRSAAWVVAKDGKGFTVFDPRCPHLGCPFRWDVKDKRFLCPCHAAVFALDGRVLSGPAPRPLDHYPAQVVEGRLQILPQPSRKKS